MFPGMRTRRPRTAALATVTTVLAVLASLPAQAAQVGTVPGPEAAQRLARGMDGTMTAADARMDLAGLTVTDDQPMTGYDRSLFPHWRDASTWGWPVEPNNACNARNAALYRDGDDVTVPDTCTNLTGTWTDPFSGNVFDSPSDIDIDHIVPLAEAWRSGAGSWDRDTRTAFANDPLVLVAAWDSLNSQKGDKDPTAWVPPNTDAHCLYANRWTQVKDGYDLTLTGAERDKVYDMLRSCGVTYDSAYSPLPAANSPAVKGGTIEADGSTTPLRSGSWVKLGADFGSAGTARTATFTYSSGVGSGVSGVLEVHRDGPEGDVVASTVVRGQDAWDSPVEVTVPASGYTAGARSVYVTFQSFAGYPVIELDALRFGTEQQSVPGVHTYRYVKNGVPVTSWSNAKWMTVPGSFSTSPVKDGAWIALPSAWGTFRGDEVTFRYANGGPDVGQVELRLDGPEGRVLAVAEMAPTPADTTAAEVTVPLIGDPPQGDRTVYAVFTGPAEETFGNLISYRVH